VISRFAPSTTGEAHPGTLLSALLVWLDARARGGRVVLRLEDLDTTRARAEWSQQLREACAWLGLDWDAVVVQSDRRAAHEAALDTLAAADRLYACTCSRTQRAGGRRAPDGGWAYPNTCRANITRDWRARDAAVSIRARLPDDHVALVDELGVDLSQTPALDMGDPVAVRKDGVVAYQLAVVVDDHDSGITDVVRGRDIAASTATQILLQRLLGYATPHYKHHFLLLESQADKLSKLHGSIPFTQLRTRYDARGLSSALARLANLGAGTPRELLATFAWSRVPREDVLVRWDVEI
jgi:glutamyl-Q tRNA(Asp) synthetase